MPHIQEEELELYCMDLLSDEARTAVIDVHLLYCTACQDRVESTDDFIWCLQRASSPHVRALAQRENRENDWGVATLERRARYVGPASTGARLRLTGLSILWRLTETVNYHPRLGGEYSTDVDWRPTVERQQERSRGSLQNYKMAPAK